MKFVNTTVDEQYTVVRRTYNIDALERSSTSPPAKRKELKGYAAWNKKHSYTQSTDARDELTRYRNIDDLPDG